MIRKATLFTGVVLGVLWCSWLANTADSSEPPPAGSTFKPVAYVHGLMTGQGLVFNQIQQVLTNKKAAQRSEQIDALAQVLAELANVNTLNNEKADYRAWAAQLRDTALQLSAEGKKNQGASEEKLNELFLKVKNTCQACHDVYQD
jgi:hypothetical protein